MNLKLIAYNIGIITSIMAFAMIFALVWALPILGGVWEQEKYGVWALGASIVLTGWLSYFFFRLGSSASKDRVFRREAIATVGLGWIFACICGALPYILSGVPRAVLKDGTSVRMTAVDALYESVSGLTTTGVSVIKTQDELDLMPRTILFWRSMTHFIGGLGVVVLLVALLDTGMAGRLLVSGEITGPKQTVQGARIQIVMRRTMEVYFVLNALLIVSLLFCGLNWFDSLCYSFGTIATGGLDPHASGFPYKGVNQSAFEWVMSLFMLISGMNLLSLYFFSHRNWKPLLKSSEWRCYILLVLASVGIISYLEFPGNIIDGTGVLSTVRQSFFHVTSCITTTGYLTCDYSYWEVGSQMVILGLMFVSACSGSTTGGFKIVRYILLFKILHLELEKLYRPAIVRPLCYDGEQVRDSSIASGVLQYFSIAFVTILFTWLALAFLEPDSLWVSQSNLAACKLSDLFGVTISHFANVGLGTGSFVTHHSFGELTQCSKFLLLCVMLLGRLDFFAIILLFSPAFWKT